MGAMRGRGRALLYSEAIRRPDGGHSSMSWRGGEDGPSSPYSSHGPGTPYGDHLGSPNRSGSPDPL